MVKNWSEMEKDQLYKWLKGLLVQGEVGISFEKKDGTLRDMKCTLKEVPSYEKKTDTVRKENKDVLSVFDLEKMEWRSFRLDSIKEIKFNLE